MLSRYGRSSQWAYAHDVAILPVGGATGFSGGIVPVHSGPAVAIALNRLNRVRSFDPLLWRIEVEAGVTTATVHRLAKENGLMFGPDPGAAEQSQIGGNLATNAGGPHAFKYGVTSHWVTGDRGRDRARRAGAVRWPHPQGRGRL